MMLLVALYFLLYRIHHTHPYMYMAGVEAIGVCCRAEAAIGEGVPAPRNRKNRVVVKLGAVRRAFVTVPQ